MAVCKHCGGRSFELYIEGENGNLYKCDTCGALLGAPKPSVDPSRLDKNEFLALELTKAWCGQSGMPASRDHVMESYFKFLADLDEHDKEGAACKSDT